MIIKENEEGGKRYEDVLDQKLTPIDCTVEDVVTALENGDFYGSYISNMRNKKEIEAGLIKHFGPNLPTHKKPLEKAQGFPFPPKTKQGVDDFIKSFNSKPNLLTYDVNSDNNNILFPTNKNTSKQNTKKILSTVLGNAGLKYKLQDIESLGELRQQIKEAIRLKKIAGLK